jgi:hypothetical protein
MFETALFASTSRVSMASDESGFYDMASPIENQQLCNQPMRATRRSTKRLAVAGQPIVAPPPVKVAKQMVPPVASNLTAIKPLQVRVQRRACILMRIGYTWYCATRRRLACTRYEADDE